MRQYVSNKDCAASHADRGCLMQHGGYGLASAPIGGWKAAAAAPKQQGGLGYANVAICAATGTAWLLQLIEDMQQSRAFHDTCELSLPRGQAAKIPEARYFRVPTCMYCSYE